MKRIVIALVAVALAFAFVPQAEAGPLRRAANGARAVGGKVVKVFKRATRPLRRSGC
jgi:hypothetical protein